MPVHFLDRVHRPANGAIAVGIVLEVRLEDWFQHELGGGLNHPIANRRNAERSLASAVWLRDHHPPHRVGAVLLRDCFLARARQPRLQAPLLDLGKTHPVHTWSARIRASQPVGMAKDVFTTNLVVEHVEAKGGLRLSPCDRAFSEGSGSSQVLPGSSPITFTSPSSKAHQKSGSFPPPALPGFNGRMTPSDSRHGPRLMRR